MYVTERSGGGNEASAEGGARRRSPARWLIERRLAKLRGLDLPLTLELWDGERVALGASSRVTLKLASPAALADLARPGLDRLAEAYVAGRIDFDGPIEEIARAAARLAASADGAAVRRRPRRPVRRGRAAGRAAIAHHYDVSNAFYESFLDESMTYSCAYFRTDDASLEQAQFDKLEHVCRKLGLVRGMRLLDVGCGWGSLATHAARRFGVDVVGITLSAEQHALAEARVAEAGLADRVTIRLQDYRDLPAEERFDRIASIGMIEHVGAAALPDWSARVERALVPGGLALVHGITTSSVDGSRVGFGAGRFIERHVFPDGELLHAADVVDALAGAGLELLDAESLRRHYARTLWQWSARFDARLQRLRALAGERRTRAWRAYLAGCAVGFEAGWVNVYQFLVARPGGGEDAADIDAPMTRDRLYVRPEREPRAAAGTGR